MTGLVFPNAIWDLRDWLRSHPLLADLTAERVFFRLPKLDTAPFMRLYRVGGGPQASEAPKQDLRFAHEIWGLADTDYLAVTQTVQALESLYQSAQNELMGPSDEAGGSGTVLHYARVTGAPDSPDPDTGRPRIVVDVITTVSLPEPPNRHARAARKGTAMAVFTPSAQRVPVGPGTLYAAPLGTDEPTSVTGAWPDGWTAIGFTDKGNDRSYKPTYQTVEVDEELEPIRYVPSTREISVSFSVAEITVVNALLSLNAGIGTSALSDVTGTVGNTTWVEPPDLGEEVRVMLGWDAASEGATPDGSADYLGRSIYRQCIQTGEIKSTHQKGNNKYLYTVTFNLEKPSGARVFRDLFPTSVAA